MTKQSGSIQVFHLSPEAEQGFAYAQATSVGDYVHIAGTLSLDDAFAVVGEGDMAAQLTQIYKRVAKTLQAHGLGFQHIVKETVYVTDMDAMLGANGVRAATYGKHTPACTVVEVRRLAFPACLAEIELTAWKGA